MSLLQLGYSRAEGGAVRVAATCFRSGSGAGPEAWGVEPRVTAWEPLRDLSREYWSLLETACRAVQFAESDDLADELARGSLDRLIPLGERLRDALVPSWLVERWLRESGLRHLAFEIDPSLNGVPFEAMRVAGEFVGFRWSVGRRLQTQAPPVRRSRANAPLTGFSVVDPGGTIGCPEVREAFARFRALPIRGTGGTGVDWSRARVGQTMTSRDMADVFRSHGFVNVVAHHEYDEVRPECSGFLLGGGQRFSADDLVSNLPPGSEVPRLVVAIACDAAVTRGWDAAWPDPRRLFGWVDAALRVGIPHFIAAGARIPRRRSTRLLEVLHPALGQGATVGEALREARLGFRRNPVDARDAGTLWGLSFLLYGEPATGGVDSHGRWKEGDDDPGLPGVLGRSDSRPNGPVVDASRPCRDPRGRHPGEARRVAPGEIGWMRGLCPTCLAAEREAVLGAESPLQA